MRVERQEPDVVEHGSIRALLHQVVRTCCAVKNSARPGQHNGVSPLVIVEPQVYGLAGRHEYVEKMGEERLLRLRPLPAPSGSVDYGEYR